MGGRRGKEGVRENYMYTMKVYKEILGGGGAMGRAKNLTVWSYPSSHLRLDLRDEDDDDPE